MFGVLPGVIGAIQVSFSLAVAAWRERLLAALSSMLSCVCVHVSDVDLYCVRQATEVIKALTGIGQPLSGRLLIYDALNMQFREIGLSKRPDTPRITSLVDYDARCADTQLAEKAEEGYARMSVTEAKQRLERGWSPFVLDVRMPQEAEIVSLPFTDALCAHRNIEEIVPRLPRDTDILVYCKAGARSRIACAELAARGFTRLISLDGGIKAWAEQVDRRMPVY